MPKRNKISREEMDEIIKARGSNKDITVNKWLTVLLMHAMGKNRYQTAMETGYSEQYITELVAEYRREGLESFLQKQYKGNHRNMSIEEEREILAGFKKLAEEGKVIEVSEIKAAYEEKAGHNIGGGQIYRVLERHDWRKVMPRSKHPNKATDEAIEASKKLTLESGK